MPYILLNITLLIRTLELMKSKVVYLIAVHFRCKSNYIAYMH